MAIGCGAGELLPRLLPASPARTVAGSRLSMEEGAHPGRKMQPVRNQQLPSFITARVCGGASGALAAASEWCLLPWAC